MQRLEYSGIIIEGSKGECDYILYIGETCIADALNEITGKQVTVRYWITDKPITKDKVQEAFIHKLAGQIFSEIEAHYSETTGYLWTDENLKVGGHDLLAEFHSNMGKYIFLEIEVY